MAMHRYSTPLPYGESNGTLFALVVDDLVIKSTSQASTSHLLQALRDKYQITVDPSGTELLGFVLDWDYPARKVYLSMPNFVQHAIHRLQHSFPKRLQHAPHHHNKPAYLQKIQFSDSQDDTKEFFLPASAKTLIQQIIGIFSILASLWTPPCYWPWVPYQPNSQNQLNIFGMKLLGFSTMLPLTQMRNCFPQPAT